jgi:hypothetical protein
MLKLFGTEPSNFEFVRLTNIGCIDAKSIWEVNDALFFLGSKGVYRYNGGLPELISYDLNETYVTGKAGGDNRNYYISLGNGLAYYLYVFDTWLNFWVMEDTLRVKESAWLSGYLYALANDNKVYKFNFGTETVTMELTSKMFTQDTMNKKMHSQLDFRVALETDTTFTVYTKIDNDTWGGNSGVISPSTPTTYSTVSTLSGFNLFSIPLPVERCDHFQIDMVMVGDGKLYESVMSYYVASKTGTTRQYTAPT